MMSKSFNMRCSMCNGFTQLKKFPDRRFKKNRIGNKKSGNHKVKSDVPSKSVSPSDIRKQFEVSPTTIALSET